MTDTARKITGLPRGHVPRFENFRKRPVIITAYQHTGEKPLHIHTLEGVMQANPGDWVITGVKGEQYPCKPDIFEATYELVEEVSEA